ncbi:MAG TPA: rhodanese-like domain-containing protein [Methanosarcina sp.]|nr:rhodanese-like domain-containing protein [Methanosarcina sp.]
MSKQKLAYLAFFFVLVVAIAIFALKAEDKPGEIENVTVEEAKRMIENEDVFVLDVRTPSEFNSSHIEGATLIPVTNAFGSNLNRDSLLEARINEVPRNEKILVYCRSGHRSTLASTILIDAGYSRVYNMEGGINAWINAGYPVISSEDKEIESLQIEA